MSPEEQIYKNYSVLIVDNDGENLESFRLNFRNKFNIITAGSGQEGIEELAEPDREVAVLIADQRIPGMSVIEFFSRAAEKRPDMMNIIMSAHTEPSVLVSAINRGFIHRFVLKPWKSDDLEIVLKEAIKKYNSIIENHRRVDQIRAVNEYLKDEIRESCDYERIVGADSGLRDVMEQVRRVAVASGNVLLRGEPGVGKELIARALHHLSPRRDRAMIKVDVASFQPRGLETELFGVETGPRGATAARIGRLELAHGSAVFIDDVADLPIETQVKLGRVLKERDFERIGGSETIRVDIRVIAASKRAIEDLMARRQFREELFNSLNTFTIPIPPLRERREDIPALVQHFLDRFSKKLGAGPVEIEPGVMERLEDYHWPGNVLELENVVQRAVVLCRGGRIRVEDLGFMPYFTERPPLPERPSQEPARTLESDANLKDRLEEMERIGLIDALKSSQGHMTKAAQKLGINRSTMYYRMKKFGIGQKDKKS